MTFIVVTNRQYEQFNKVKDKKTYSKILKETNLLNHPEVHQRYLNKAKNNHLIGAETNLIPFYNT